MRAAPAAACQPFRVRPRIALSSAAMRPLPCLLAVLAMLAVSGFGLDARAQDVPAPPAAYASATLGADLVLEPLVAAAEADLAQGNTPLAMARAQLVLTEVAASSTVHVRAEGIVMLGGERGAQAATDTPPDVLLAPLVDAASSDVTASRFTLARARLAWVLTRVAPDGALGIRATAISRALEARAASASGTLAAPTVTPIAPPTAPATSSPRWVVVAPGTPPPTAPAIERPPVEPATPADPRRRSDAEIVDLYITFGVMGAGIGVWAPVSTGALASLSDRDEQLALTGALVGGTGVFLLGAFGLDQIGGGLRSGQPDAIAQGTRFGLVMASLSIGIYGADHSLDTGGVFDMLGIGLLGGTALGAIAAFGLEPHPAQTEFTQNTGIWGAILGAELGALVAPLAYPNFGSEDERQQLGFGLPLAGLAVGILTGAALSAAHENFSSRRSWLMTVGALGGAGAGSLVWFLVSQATSSFDVATWGGIAGLGSIGGLVLVGLLTTGDDGPRSWDGLPDVQVAFTPTVGGATVGLSGTF